MSDTPDYLALSQTTYARNLRRDLANVDTFVTFQRPARLPETSKRKSRSAWFAIGIFGLAVLSYIVANSAFVLR